MIHLRSNHYFCLRYLVIYTKMIKDDTWFPEHFSVFCFHAIFKATFHLQLWHNIGYNPCVVQYILAAAAAAAAAAAKSLQSCSTLCYPVDGSPPGSPVPGIIQARTLEWVAISFSNALKWKVKVKSSVVSNSSWPYCPHPTRLLCPWDFPGKSTGVGCHCLLHVMC